MSSVRRAETSSSPIAFSTRTRVLGLLNLALFLLGVLILVVVVNFFSRHGSLRFQIDATKTRAYSLSEQSRQLLDGLQSSWTIAMLVHGAGSGHTSTDRAMRRQIEEVLKRYTEGAPQISVVWIDPGDPKALSDYDALLTRLRAVYHDEVAAYETALDTGVEAYDALESIARQQVPALQQVVARIPRDAPEHAQCLQHLGVLTLIADEGRQVLEQVSRARAIDERRPLPDYETARSILTAALSGWAIELDTISESLERWLERVVRDNLDRVAQQLASAADQLKRLPPSELGVIAAQMAQGEMAIVVGPQRAAAIPSAQLFPRSNFQQSADGGVTFDQRFRGEQLISAAIRSLTVDHMPLVVFVHAEEESLLRKKAQQADLVGAASVLRANRFEVAEWHIGRDSDRPVHAQGQPVVWVILPLTRRPTLEPLRNEQLLLEAVRGLLADGEAVLLNVYPSELPKYGQPDAWAALAEAFGVAVESSRVVVENLRVSEDRQERQLGVALKSFPHDHPIARAVDGQQTYFPLPMPVRFLETESRTVARQIVVSVAPSSDRWLESDWRESLRGMDEPTEAERFAASLPLVVAAERPHPSGGGRQRVILAGSGGWMLTFVADLVVQLGGDRVALVNPGNYELMLASIAWLAGMDDLIAAGPGAQEVARLHGITPAVRTRWFWLFAAGIPAVWVAVGVFFWFARRR